MSIPKRNLKEVHTRRKSSKYAVSSRSERKVTKELNITVQMRLFLTVSIIIAFVHSILFSISLVIENSRSAVSEEQPKLETNSFSSVLSGFVI